MDARSTSNQTPSHGQSVSRANDDPRVIASRERLLAIPKWRLIKAWRAGRQHARLFATVQGQQPRLSHEELEAKLATADAMYRAQGSALEDCRELLADAKRDADGWCERAAGADAAAASWEHEYKAAQAHVEELQRRLGWAQEPIDDE